MAEPATFERTRKPRRGRGWRVFAWIAGALGLALVLAATTLDHWAPALAFRLGGVRAERSATTLGREVAKEGVSWRRDGLTLEARRLTTSAPWRILRRGEVDATLSDWVLVVDARPDDEPRPERPRGEGGWEELVPMLRRVAGHLERWVGEVELRDGLVRVAGEEIAVERVTVRGDRFGARATGRGHTVNLAGALGATSAELRWEEGGVVVDATLEAERARAELRWEGNVATFEADFAPGDWMPARLRARGEDWTVPAERLGQGERYAVLRGGFDLWGEGEHLRAGLRAQATPRGDGFPELRLELAGEGGRDRVRVERVELEAPQARARLSAPVEWRRGAGWSGEGAPGFSWEADLAALSGGSVGGRVEGSARWTPGAAADWSVSWNARGAGLTWDALPATNLAVRGVSDAAATTITEATLSAADGSAAELRGRVAHATRALEGGVVVARLRGALLAPWLPEGARVESAEAEGRAEGAWPALTIAGEARVTRAEHAGWAAETVTADVAGTLGESLRGAVELRRGEAELRARFEVGEGEARAEEFSWRRGEAERLRAVAPIFVRWAGEGRRAMAELAGADGVAARVEWRAGQALRVRASGIETEWIDDWRSEPGAPRLHVRSVEVEGGIGPDGHLAGEARFDLGGEIAGGPVWARGAARAGDEGLRVEQLEAGRGGERLVEGAGLVPWRLREREGREFVPVPGQEWSLRLESRAGAEWWDELAKAGDLKLVAPTLSLEVLGPARAPSGRAELGAERVGFEAEGLPEGGVELRGLSALAELTPDAITLRRLRATVDGQAISAEARLPMGAADWARLRENPLAWARDHAEARLRVSEAQVAAMARYLPTLLAPQGTLAAELRLSPPARVDGWLALQGAATRPLGSFGVLQEVDVRLALSGMDVRIERMRATAGGQELRVTGGARRRADGKPELDLAVKAERFPLVRQPGLLFRGDLDLTVKSDAQGRTRVGGEVRLRDSLFLVDIRPLLAARGGGGGGAARRPPYFSVETPPLADWELGLRVGGVEFLRMRTPIFEGTGSARFDLAGTLREPRAVGEFWVERGNILFPFATFAVREGAVRLRASDPYTPVLDFRAEGRRLGYDLRLELNGTAENPQLQLTSSPPLEAEAALLMVTAGTSPDQGRGASGTQRLAAVGAYLGRDVLRSLGFGGDEERLTITSGENVSRQGRETYGFEFRLNDKWSLTGEYDEFDAYNVGARRRFEARPPRGASPPPEPEANEEGGGR